LRYSGLLTPFVYCSPCWNLNDKFFAPRYFPRRVLRFLTLALRGDAMQGLFLHDHSLLACSYLQETWPSYKLRRVSPLLGEIGPLQMVFETPGGTDCPTFFSSFGCSFFIALPFAPFLCRFSSGFFANHYPFSSAGFLPPQHMYFFPYSFLYLNYKSPAQGRDLREFPSGFSLFFVLKSGDVRRGGLSSRPFSLSFTPFSPLNNLSNRASFFRFLPLALLRLSSMFHLSSTVFFLFSPIFLLYSES